MHCVFKFLCHKFLHMPPSCFSALTWSFNWKQSLNLYAWKTRTHAKGFNIFLLNTLKVFKCRKQTQFDPKIWTQGPQFTSTQTPFKRVFSIIVFMVGLLRLMGSGEVCNLLCFHTNSIVKVPLPKKSSRSGSLWRQRWRAAGRQEEGWRTRGGRGHNAKCRQGGSAELAALFNLWIHCFYFSHCDLIL